VGEVPLLPFRPPARTRAALAEICRSLPLGVMLTLGPGAERDRVLQSVQRADHRAVSNLIGMMALDTILTVVTELEAACWDVSARLHRASLSLAGRGASVTNPADAVGSHGQLQPGVRCR
jgi:hypothetical protein